MLNLRSQQWFKGVKQDVQYGHIYRVLYALKDVRKLPWITMLLKTSKKTFMSLHWTSHQGFQQIPMPGTVELSFWDVRQMAQANLLSI